MRWALPRGATHLLRVGACAAFVALLLRLRALRAELARMTQLRLDERAGRTAAERRLRQQHQHQPAAAQPAGGAAPCVYHPIGHLESCYVERRGTPRQGLLAPAARSRLRLYSSSVQPAPALEGLEGFSHVWLLFHFHDNTNATKVGAPQSQAHGVGQVRAKVHPPGLGGERTGLFATRTPHRPNPIGLSAARLLEVRGDTLVLGGADLLDGTPILDVKPYLRHDVHVDASVPSWCEQRSDSSRLTRVEFRPSAEAELASCLPGMKLYADVKALRDTIEQTLLLDVRSVHQGRGTSSDGQPYIVRIDSLTISFATYATHVEVTAISAETTPSADAAAAAGHHPATSFAGTISTVRPNGAPRSANAIAKAAKRLAKKELRRQQQQPHG